MDDVQTENVLQRRRTPALCCASQQLRRETMPMYRGNNDYGLTITGEKKKKNKKQPPVLVRWLRGFSKSGVEHLRVLSIRQDIFVPWPCANGFRCELLVSLEVNGNECWVYIDQRPCAVRAQRDAQWGHAQAMEWVKTVASFTGKTYFESIGSPFVQI